MNLSEQAIMLTETPISEKAGVLEEDSSLNDLDLVAGKLSISPVQDGFFYQEIHESTASLVIADTSDANALISAFSSFNVVDCSKQGDDMAKSIGCATNGEAVLSLQTHNQIKDTHTLGSFNFANVAEPSTLRDCEPVVPDRTDELCKDNGALIVPTSSRRSGRGTKSNQNSQSVKPPRNHRRTTRKTPLLDFDSLLISRRRRSSVTKRPRHFELGPTGSIFPDSDRTTHTDQNTGIRKKTNRKSASKGKKGTGNRSVGKSCAPTRPICLKVKIGNRSVMPSIHDNLDAPEKMVSDSSDVIRSTHETNFEVNDIVNKSSSNHDRANILDQGCNLKANTENRFSDPGTSPDSEVINSVPDTEAFEKGLPDVQDRSITLSMPLSFGNVTGISSPQMKMKKGKKKDKHRLPGVCSMESKQTDKGTPGSAKELTALEPGPKSCGEELFPLDPLQCLRMVVPGTQFTTLKDAEINHSSDLVAVLESSHSEGGSMLVPCNIGQIFSKSSKAKAGSNNRSENLDLRSKKNKTSGKRGNKSSSSGMIQGTEKDEALVHNGVEGQLMTGNQSSVPGAEGSELMVDGSTNQFAPPKNAWVLCDECKKWRRISAALADQIEVTNCGWTCRENTDKDFADCSIPQEKSNSEINKELEISDEEDARENIQKFEKKPSKVDQPPPWSHIRSNFFLHRSRKTQTIDEVMVCHCKPPSDGRMGCGAKCLNRMLNIECVRGTCPCGELCSNQQFQKRKYSKLKWFRCGKKGFGLRAQEDICAGNFIIEYVGEVLDVKNYEARQRDYALKGHRHFYFMTLNGSEVIDACSKGNLGRFINHSCEPNCRTEKWMVNGEVCVGLFAIKNIKKGEEVTFDYNYVRVFGAAVKKCVCGSSNCRGYIGGDPKSSEVIIQDESDDEFSEPVMFCEDNDMGSDRNNISSDSSREKENNISGEPCEIRLGEGKLVDDADQSGIHSGTIAEKSGAMADRVVHLESEAVNSISDGSPDSIGQLNVGEDSDDSLLGSSPAAAKIGSGVPFHTYSSMQLADKSEGRMNKAVSSKLKYTPTLKDSENTALSCKPELDMEESKTKLKGDTVGRVTDLQKSNSLARTHRAAPSIKNENLKAKKSVNVHGNFDLDKSNASPYKSRKFPDPTLSSHVEAVEEKLNQLLDSEGGISKRKDASRGYLKLLILTAASGNTGDGESIQSTRDLSMILDALLKTKSRSVLVDIINKNGLQMLHNIMKRYRKEFNRTPILRKLLKILEYLAKKEILTSEHITGGPPRPGVESFKDSILTLTEHADKQVHQTARNFRDTWIRKFLRRNCHMETDEYHHHSTYSQRLSSSTSYDQHKIRGVKRPSESLHSCQKQPTPITTTVETATLDQSPAAVPTSTTNTTRTRKRKSRWDTPADENVLYTTKVTCNNTTPSLENADIDDEDVPPGFSIPCNNRSKIAVSPLSGNNQERNTSLNCASSPGVILGESQHRFTSLAPVSYGVHSCVVEQFGIRKGETPRVWTMSPGLPFCPFPPLPPHPKNSADQPKSAGGGKCSPLHGTAEKICSGTVEKASGHYHSGQKRPFICTNVEEGELSGFVDSDERGSRGGHSSGQKYFKQPKWSSNNSNNPKIPPWVRIRNGWGNA